MKLIINKAIRNEKYKTDVIIRVRHDGDRHKIKKLIPTAREYKGGLLITKDEALNFLDGKRINITL